MSIEALSPEARAYQSWREFTACWILHHELFSSILFGKPAGFVSFFLGGGGGRSQNVFRM